MGQVNATRRQFVAAAAGGAAALVGTAAAAGAAEAKGRAWDHEVDVLVAGGGIAGFVAACVAAEAGAQVTLVEKRDAVGGDAIMSAQMITGPWPERVKQYGVEDSVESFFEDWKLSAPTSDLAVEGKELPTEYPYSRRVAETLPEALAWLEKSGAVFAPATADSSAYWWYPQPIWDTCLYRAWWSTSENLMETLQRHAEEVGVEVVTGTAADSLVVEDGRVTGVVCREGDTPDIVSYGAREGVVLATGSFTGDRSLMDRYLHSPHSLVGPAGWPGNTGDGHRMALAAGATWKNMSLGSHWLMTVDGTLNNYFWAAYIGIFGGAEGKMVTGDTNNLFINYEGHRFVDETDGYKWIGQALCSQSFNKAFMVFDSTYPDQVQAAIATLDDASKAQLLVSDTLEGLADKMNVPADDFLAEIERYNGFCEKGVDEDFNRHMENVPPVAVGPFYAMRMRANPYCTYGGIDVDLDGRVVNAEGEAIPGLYAAGSSTWCFAEGEGLYYIGGLAQALAAAYSVGHAVVSD